ncbi:MAG: GreA/GreB family elongation factor [Bacteroidales bacterium]|nr:GreA/GreB family elongation factor [Bacteroidales bacterium]
MNNQRISLNRHLTNIDYGHIINLITDDIYKKHIAPSRLHLLYLLAATSTKHESSNIPEDVITLNSEIILVSEKTQRQLVKIVLPKDVNGKNDISVYNPMAIAILGKKEKDFVFIKNNKTYLKIQIEKLVFQPEKEKASHL